MQIAGNARRAGSQHRSKIYFRVKLTLAVWHGEPVCPGDAPFLARASDGQLRDAIGKLVSVVASCDASAAKENFKCTPWSTAWFQQFRKRLPVRGASQSAIYRCVGWSCATPWEQRRSLPPFRSLHTLLVASLLGRIVQWNCWAEWN